MWQGCGATGTLSHCWWQCIMVQPHWKTVWQFLTKLNRLLPYGPVNTPWYLPKVVENLFRISFIHNCQNLESTKMPFSRWADKQTVLHPDNGILALKSCQNMKRLEGTYILLSERCSLQRLHTIWLQLYDILEKAKLWKQ